jgi:hypothetical protein
VSKDAVPCIICGVPLLNVLEDCDNQPEDGTAFQTHGHYGSTAFDPQDGQYLEINVCDKCLMERADRVLWSRSSRLILCDGRAVGYERLERPLVPWNKNSDSDATIDVLNVSEEEIGQPLSANVVWHPRPRSLLEDDEV